MRVLVVGGGGREHGLVWKLRQSPRVTQVFSAPGNAGIAELAECVEIGASEVRRLAEFAAKQAVDLTVVEQGAIEFTYDVSLSGRDILVEFIQFVGEDGGDPVDLAQRIRVVRKMFAPLVCDPRDLPRKVASLYQNRCCCPPK